MDWENQPHWTANATLYTDATGLEGHRLRFLIAEKQCPVMTEVVRGAPPAVMATVNPEKQYPFLTDKMLALWCPDSIEQYIDERFPHPNLHPADPKLRAQIRQVSNTFRQYYLMEQKPWIQNAITRLAGILASSPWVAGREMTMCDIALVPWLWRLPSQKIRFPTNVNLYMRRAFAREAFIASLTPEEMGLGQAA